MATGKRIPVKVIQVKDMHGKQHTSVMLDMNFFFQPTDTYHQRLEDFKSKYLKLLEEARGVIKNHSKRKGRNAMFYWSLGELLSEFKSSITSDFYFTNYLDALERDLKISNRYIGIMIDFADFYEKNEVSNTIPMSHYFEVLSKARKLKQRGRLGLAKQDLVRLSSKNMLPDHKSLRKNLAEMLLS